jgi:acetyltransferase-like isoleucine patch superfamily enzyme
MAENVVRGLRNRLLQASGMSIGEEDFFRGVMNRLLQTIAHSAPGGLSLRPYLHRLRGVSIGRGVWIGDDATIETAYPQLVTIKDRATIGIRAIIIAHFRGERKGVVIEEDAFIGPGVIILPNVVVGRGSVVTAGSVVTTSVPPMTMVQGNPAKLVGRVGKPPNIGVPFQEFATSLRPLRPSREPDNCIRPSARQTRIVR